MNLSPLISQLMHFPDLPYDDVNFRVFAFFLTAIFLLVMGIIANTAVTVFGEFCQFFLRYLSIRKHGWPPPHCDADGDLAERDETAGEQSKSTAVPADDLAGPDEREFQAMVYRERNPEKPQGFVVANWIWGFEVRADTAREAVRLLLETMSKQSHQDLLAGRYPFSMTNFVSVKEWWPILAALDATGGIQRIVRVTFRVRERHTLNDKQGRWVTHRFAGDVWGDVDAQKEYQQGPVDSAPKKAVAQPDPSVNLVKTEPQPEPAHA